MQRSAKTSKTCQQAKIENAAGDSPRGIESIPARNSTSVHAEHTKVSSGTIPHDLCGVNGPATLAGLLGRGLYTARSIWLAYPQAVRMDGSGPLLQRRNIVTLLPWRNMQRQLQDRTRLAPPWRLAMVVEIPRPILHTPHPRLEARPCVQYTPNLRYFGAETANCT